MQEFRELEECLESAISAIIALRESAETVRDRMGRKAYDKAKYSTLEQVYITYSREKGLAYRSCLHQMDEERGANFKIVSYNSMQFTAGWTTFEGIRIETRNNSYLIPW